MTEHDDCIVCHDVDGLGRHNPMCSRASQLGLPKRAEGEEPVEAEHDPAEPPRNDQAQTTPSGPQRGGKLCVACLDYHITEDDVPNCKKVGKSLVHPQCAWRMNYEGLEAWQVIEQLEKLSIEGGVDSVESVRGLVQDVVRGNIA